MQVLIDQRPAPVSVPQYIELTYQLRTALRPVSDALWALDSAIRLHREARNHDEREAADKAILAAVPAVGGYVAALTKVSQPAADAVVHALLGPHGRYPRD